MRVITCDKCKNPIKDKPEEWLIEFFEGSVSLNNVDLCTPCIDKFRDFLEGFSKEEASQ